MGLLLRAIWSLRLTVPSRDQVAQGLVWFREGPQTRNGSLRAGEAAADEPNLLGPWLDECTAPQAWDMLGSMQALVHQLHKLHCSILN